eukprot:m.66791 g.66791  ORF g.66791 m.66791 type:complete len:220 (+) comp11838_c0_seq1:1783-2442(+)
MPVKFKKRISNTTKNAPQEQKLPVATESVIPEWRQKLKKTKTSTENTSKSHVSSYTPKQVDSRHTDWRSALNKKKELSKDVRSKTRLSQVRQSSKDNLLKPRNSSENLATGIPAWKAEWEQKRKSKQQQRSLDGANPIATSKRSISPTKSAKNYSNNSRKTVTRTENKNRFEAKFESQPNSQPAWKVAALEAKKRNRAVLKGAAQPNLLTRTPSSQRIR